jgi:type II secretory pathway component PulF
VINSVERGEKLSDALQKEKFPDYFVAVIRIGEEGGDIVNVLKFLNKLYDYKKSVKQALISSFGYSFVLLPVVLIASFFIVNTVLPHFVEMFRSMGETLPIPTQIVMFIYKFLGNSIWFLIIILAVVIFAFIKSQALRDKIKYKIPLAGKIYWKADWCFIIDMLVFTLNFGYPIDKSFRLISNIATGKLHRDLARVADNLGRGVTLSESFAGIDVPETLLWITRSGEKQENLVPVFIELNQLYKMQVEFRTQVLSMVIERGSVLVMGVIVGLTVLSLFLPLLLISTEWIK